MSTCDFIVYLEGVLSRPSTDSTSQQTPRPTNMAATDFTTQNTHTHASPLTITRLQTYHTWVQSISCSQAHYIRTFIHCTLCSVITKPLILPSKVCLFIAWPFACLLFTILNCPLACLPGYLINYQLYLQLHPYRLTYVTEVTFLTMFLIAGMTFRHDISVDAVSVKSKWQIFFRKSLI